MPKKEFCTGICQGSLSVGFSQPRYFRITMLRQLVDICRQVGSSAAAESSGLRAAVLSFQNLVLGPDAGKRYFGSSQNANEEENIVRLNTLRDNPGATHQVRLAWLNSTVTVSLVLTGSNVCL